MANKGQSSLIRKAPADDARPDSELANEAMELFHTQSYNECLRILRDLRLRNPKDPKIRHNIAVAEYYRDGCTDPKKVLKVLEQIKKGRKKKLPRAKDQQGGSDPPESTSGSTSSSTRTGGLSSPTRTNISDNVANKEANDKSILTLNSAVLLYRLQQYAAAKSILEPLYRNKSIDEAAALRACYLMLDITLTSGQAGKAAEVLQYMEEAFPYLLYTDNKSIDLALTSSTTSPTSKSLSFDSSQPITRNRFAALEGLDDEAQIDFKSSTTSPISKSLSYDSFQPITRNRFAALEGLDDEAQIDFKSSTTSPISKSLSYDSLQPITRNAFAALEGLDEAQIELSEKDASQSTPSGEIFDQSIFSQEATTSVAVARVKPCVKIDLAIHLYRVRFFLLIKNFKATRRALKYALNLSRDHMTLLLLKAQLEFSLGHYDEALKQLTECIGRAEPALNGMVYSNLGCIHHQLRKHQIASVYIRKAVLSSATPKQRDSSSATAISEGKSLPIIYNAGLQQLACNNPVLAARCFQEAAAQYYNQPSLWLRLAECCIVALRKGLLEGISNTGEDKKLKIMSIGEGILRRIVLPAGSLNPLAVNDVSGLNFGNLDGDAHKPGDNGSWFKLGQPFKLSLPFAIQCLRVAIQLLDQSDDNGAKVAAEAGVVTSSAAKGKDSKGLSAALAKFEARRIQGTATLRIWALAALSYCQLGICHPLGGLRSAQLLLQHPACSRSYALLGRLYEAEALCQLERPQEAAEHLWTYLNDISVESSDAENESLKLKPSDSSEASVDGDNIATSTAGALGDTDSFARLTGPNARASLYVNLAAVYSMRGDLLEAHYFAQWALATNPTNPMALLALVYVEISMGSPRTALALLKEHRHLCDVTQV